MRVIRTAAIWSVALLIGPAAQAEPTIVPEAGIDQLIDRFHAGAPKREGSVTLDAWVEADAEGSDLVVVVQPEGETKLVADPGITITPLEQPGVEWLVPLPHRHVDPEIDYFTPPASVRLPFRASDDLPLEILVEYAYCFVDYQCFFGEEVLTVASRSP